MKIRVFIKLLAYSLLILILSKQTSYGQEYLRNVVQVNLNLGNVSTGNGYAENEDFKSIGLDLIYRFRFRPHQSIGINLGLNKELFSEFDEKMKYRQFLLTYKITTKATKRFQGYFSPGFGLCRSKYFVEEYYYNTNGVKISKRDERKIGAFTYGLGLGMDYHLQEHFILNLGIDVYSAKQYLGAICKLGLAYKF